MAIDEHERERTADHITVPHHDDPFAYKGNMIIVKQGNTSPRRAGTPRTDAQIEFPTVQGMEAVHVLLGSRQLMSVICLIWGGTGIRGRIPVTAGSSLRARREASASC